jgi:hypothetical protein
VAVDLPLDDDLGHRIPVRDGSAKPSEDGRWLNDHRLAGEKATRAGSKYGIRGWEIGARCRVSGVRRTGVRDTGDGAGIRS